MTVLKVTGSNRTDATAQNICRTTGFCFCKCQKYEFQEAGGHMTK
jgi:hypothetical protein